MDYFKTCTKKANQSAAQYEKLLFAKEEYLVCAKDAHCEASVSLSYTKTDQAYRKALMYRYDEIEARLNYQDTLKPHLHPATIGGLVSGIAGPVAGTIAAHNAAQNEATKLANQSTYENQIINSQFEGAESNKEFTSCVQELSSKIDNLSHKDLAEKDAAFRHKLENGIRQARQRAYELDKFKIVEKLITPLGFLTFLLVIFGIALISLEEFGAGIPVAILGGVLTVLALCAQRAAKRGKSEQARLNNWYPTQERLLEEYKKVLATHSYAFKRTAICDTITKQ